MIDGPPGIGPPAVDLHEDLIQVPAPVARPQPRNPAFSDFRGKHRAESIPPEPHRFVENSDPAFVQQILDVPKRQWKPDVHHNRQADDLRAPFEVPERGEFGRDRRQARRLHRLKRCSFDRDGIRPENVGLSEAARPGTIPATVDVMELTGPEKLVSLRTGAGPLTASLAPSVTVHAGMAFHVVLDAPKIVLFNSQTGLRIDGRAS